MSSRFGFHILIMSLAVPLLSACTSSDTAAIDSLLGRFNSAPILTSVPAQLVAQEDLLKVDVNNIKEGLPGTDEKMSYSCTFDVDVDGKVETGTACSSLPGGASFGAATGVLEWTPSTSVLGNFEIKIKGVNEEGVYEMVFTAGVRLAFDGIVSVTNINGLGATLNWTPNTAATSYQVFKRNSSTGDYELFQTVSGGASSNIVLTTLAPNLGYTFRVKAMDALGFLDANAVSRSFTTTELVKFALSPASATLSAGTPQTITIQAYNADNSPQTVGGLVLAPQIQSGTSAGTFGAVTDNDDGTYDFTFTPTTVGTPIKIEITTSMTFFLQNTADLTITPGAASSATTTVTSSGSTVASSSSVTLTATVKDAYNNPISSGSTVAFSLSGGTSTGTLGTVTNQGNGVYSATFTGVVAGTALAARVVVDGVTLTPSASVQVLPGTPVSVNSTVTSSSATVASGNAVTVTAVLRDINNNVVPSGVAVSFNKTGGTSSGTLGAVVNAGAGVYTTTYTGITAGTAQILSVVVDGVTLAPTDTVQVVPGAAALANSTLTISSPTVTSGQFVTVTATLRDANNNPIESGVTVTFSKTGGTSTGTFGGVTDQGNGVYNIRYTGIAAGTAQTIAVLLDGVALGHTVGVDVTPGAPSAAKSTLSAATATVVSGQAVTVSATLKDDNDNLISSGHTVGFSKVGGTSTGTYGSVTNQGNGVYTVNYTGVTAGTAQTLGVTVGGIALGPTDTVSVIPGSPDNTMSTMTVSAATVIAGQSVTMTATVRDANGNPISSGVLVDFSPSGGTSTGSVSGVVNQGNGVYTATYTGVTAGTAQTLQTLVDLAPLGPPRSVQVLVGAPVAAKSSLTVTSSPLSSGSSAVISAVVRDSQNNPITTEYAISFDAIGGSSTGNFGTQTDDGAGTFDTTYEGVTAGTAQTIRVLADGIPIAGLTKPLQVVAGPVDAGNSSFTIAQSTVQSGTAVGLTVSLRDANGNPINGASVTFNKSSGGSDGTIASPAAFTSNGNYNSTYTGTVQGTAQTITLVVGGTAIPAMTVSATVTAGPPAQLAISQPANPRNPIDCNGPYTVTLKDASNNTTSSLSGMTIALDSVPAHSHDGVLFADAGCTMPLTQLDYGVMGSAASFYYKSFVPQNFTLSLDAPSPIADGSLGITSLPVLSWIGTGASSTMNGSGPASIATDGAAGFVDALDATISGDYMYVADYGANRVLKYNITTNTYMGWIGHVGSVDGLSCTGLNVGDLTPGWCTGGRSLSGTPSLMIQPRGLGSDGTYLYVSSQHRVLRFNQATGAFAGWIGLISSTVPTSPSGCVGAGNGDFTPTWCMDGTHKAGAGDGAFNTIVAIHHRAGKLYITDRGNHRIQKWDVNGTYEGWIGRIDVQPTSPASCATAALGDPTPTWCFGGESRVSSRRSLTCCTTVTPAPPEGFNEPEGSTSDANYLYVADKTNMRIVRIALSTGSFAGWIGYLQRGTGSSGNYPTSPPLPVGYTSTWVQGGGSTERTGVDGFGGVIGIDYSDGYLYVTDGYHRVIRVSAADGQDYEWIGRVSTSPIGGFVGCSSTPISGVTPGWCVGGGSNRYGNINSSFYQPYSVLVNATKMFVVDRYNYRVQRFNKATGEFDGWIGAAQVNATQWRRTSPPAFARNGYNDYSFGETADWAGIALNDDFLFVTDPGWHRIKKHNRKDGSIVGYIGQISNYAPTGPDSCLGFTSGMTPDWCTGGGRTTSGSGIHGYNAPYAVAADGASIYIANYANHRVDRVRITDALYLGWIGRSNVVPTDGGSACTNNNSGDPVPQWCIGGTAQAGYMLGAFRYPRAVHYDPAISKLFVADDGKVVRVDPATGDSEAMIGHVTTAGAGCSITGGAASGWCGAGANSSTGANTYGSVSNPTGLATNSTYLYVADAGNHRIHRYEKSTGAPAGFLARMTNGSGLNTTATGGACQGLGGYPTPTPGWCFGNAVGTTVNTSAGAEEGSFNSPRGIWADDSYVYVVDSVNNRIVRFKAATGEFDGWKGFIISTAGMTDPDCIAAGAGSVTPKWCKGGEAGPSTLLGGFDLPTGINGDANYLYVQDGRNNRIVTIPR